MYTYVATITDVIDGDTVRADVDLGFSIRQRTVLRLLGLNTPEIVGASKSEGQKAQYELADRIYGRDVIVKTSKDKKEKYGRYLAVIFLGDENINEWMLQRWPSYKV